MEPICLVKRLNLPGGTHLGNFLVNALLDFDNWSKFALEIYVSVYEEQQSQETLQFPQPKERNLGGAQLKKFFRKL